MSLTMTVYYDSSSGKVYEAIISEDYLAWISHGRNPSGSHSDSYIEYKDGVPIRKFSNDVVKDLT